VSPPATTGSFADELYDVLGPLAEQDAALGWHLLHFCSAFGLPFQLVEDLGRDTDAGPGWSALLDVDRCPTWGLGYLGQYRGVRLPPIEAFETPEEYDAAMRDRIRRADGFNRGRTDALRATIERYLTGTRYVVLNERVGGDAYELGVLTRADETPYPALLEQRVREDQKPGGIRLTLVVTDLPTYAAHEVAYDRYIDFEAAQPTYQHAEENLP
jgi:hypothetical protein